MKVVTNPRPPASDSPSPGSSPARGRAPVPAVNAGGFPLPRRRRQVPREIRAHREAFGQDCTIVASADRYRCDEHGALPKPEPRLRGRAPSVLEREARAAGSLVFTLLAVVAVIVALDPLLPVAHPEFTQAALAEARGTAFAFTLIAAVTAWALPDTLRRALDGRWFR